MLYNLSSASLLGCVLLLHVPRSWWRPFSTLTAQAQHCGASFASNAASLLPFSRWTRWALLRTAPFLTHSNILTTYRAAFSSWIWLGSYIPAIVRCDGSGERKRKERKERKERKSLLVRGTICNRMDGEQLCLVSCLRQVVTCGSILFCAGGFRGYCTVLNSLSIGHIGRLDCFALFAGAAITGSLTHAPCLLLALLAADSSSNTAQVLPAQFMTCSRTSYAAALNATLFGYLPLAFAGRILLPRLRVRGFLVTLCGLGEFRQRASYRFVPHIPAGLLFLVARRLAIPAAFSPASFQWTCCGHQLYSLLRVNAVRIFALLL